MKKIKLILLLFTLLALTACPKVDYKHDFMFINNAGHDIYVYLKVPYEGDFIYPDTTIAYVRCGALFKSGASFAYTYNYRENEMDTLILFIFDADVFNTYSWEEIRDEYKILQRYDIKFGSIKALEYNISYPPDERMKNMKMYPPYRSE